MAGETFERLLTVSLTVAALAVAGATIVRARSTPASDNPGSAVVPEWQEGWDAAREAAVQEGAGDSPLKIVVVSDPECPACKYFSRVLGTLRSERSDIVVYTHHIALPQHRFAPIAIRGIECARGDAVQPQMMGLMFKYQDSLGLKAWEEIAREAGVRSQERWLACLRGTETLAPLEASAAFARMLDVRSTPTVIVNGWRINRALSAEELRDLVTDLSEHGRPATTARTR